MVTNLLYDSDYKQVGQSVLDFDVVPSHLLRYFVPVEGELGIVAEQSKEFELDVRGKETCPHVQLFLINHLQSATRLGPSLTV